MAESVPKRKGSDVPQKERFFRYFQHEITGGWEKSAKFCIELTVNLSDLQAQMGRLGETSVIGGERTDAIDHLVAGIARLGNEVTDASGYLPAYDQRTYGEVSIFFTLVLCRAKYSG